MAKLSLAEHETVITYIEIDAHIWPKVIAVTALLKSKVYSLSLLGVDLGVNLKIELVKPLLLEAFRGLFDSRRPTNTQNPNPYRLGFFLPDRAGSRVLARVPANACGLSRPPKPAFPGHISLSPGHSSLRPRSPKIARSPQRP